MNAVRGKRDELFVVRMWFEGEYSVQTPWRASVTHVSSGRRHYFTNYGELCEFLERWRRKD